MSCSERLSPCSCKYCAACLFSSGCFSACCRAAESLRKTGSPNPRWNAALDSVQLGWLMHQVPNTMALLWWGDVLCSPHFTGAFFSFFSLPSRSCIVQAGEKKLSWMFQVCSSSSVLLNVSVRSERQVVSAVTSWRAVVMCRLVGRCRFALWAVKPNQLLCLKAAAVFGCRAGYQLKLLSGAEWDYVERPSSSVSGSLLHLET